MEHNMIYFRIQFCFLFLKIKIFKVLISNCLFYSRWYSVYSQQRADQPGSRDQSLDSHYTQVRWIKGIFDEIRQIKGIVDENRQLKGIVDEIRYLKGIVDEIRQLKGIVDEFRQIKRNVDEFRQIKRNVDKFM